MASVEDMAKGGVFIITDLVSTGDAEKKKLINNSNIANQTTGGGGGGSSNPGTGATGPQFT